MPRLLICTAFALLSGCMSLASVASVPPTAGRPSCSPAEAAALPEGSRVELTREWTEDGGLSDRTNETRRLGTVLKSSPEGIALANCVVEQNCRFDNVALGRMPYLGRLYRDTGTSYVEPVVWIPVEQMGNVRVIEPPPEGFVPTAIVIDTTPRELTERITGDMNCFSDRSPETTVELVDAPTGRVFRKEVRVHDGDGTRVVDESFGNDGADRTTPAGWSEVDVYEP